MVEAHRPETRWVTRLIPVLLAACVGLSAYVFVKRICVDFYIGSQQQSRTATIFLAFYSVFLLLMLLSYFRVYLVIQFHPGVVPLGPKAVEQREREKERRRAKRKVGGLCGPSGEDDLEANRYEGYWPDPSVDSPGLERFYSKDVFACHTDGRPRWCSSCCNWKQDRASHCSDLNRCVKKMDHYCPWIGGVVGETSYKFFTQFTFYTAIYCVVVLTGASMCLRSLILGEAVLDGFVIAAIAIAGFFGLFTFSMTVTAVRYICVNLTNVDYLKAQTLVHQLAIRVPRDTEPSFYYSVVTYPLPKPEPASPSAQSSDHTAVSEPVSSRDLLATRKFAIVRTEKGENPWDLGVYRNWKSVMGNNVIDWLLPFNPSPCENFENNESFYEMGPLVQELRARFKLPALPSDEKGNIELGELGEQHEHRAKGGVARTVTGASE